MNIFFLDVGTTKPAMAMPDEYRVGYSVVQLYRNYHNGDKVGFTKWTKRETPEWFNKREELCN